MRGTAAHRRRAAGRLDAVGHRSLHGAGGLASLERHVALRRRQRRHRGLALPQRPALAGVAERHRRDEPGRRRRPALGLRPGRRPERLRADERQARRHARFRRRPLEQPDRRRRPRRAPRGERERPRDDRRARHLALALAGAAAAHLRRLLPERRVRERLQRLVQRRELARQPEEVLVVVGAAVELRELVADPVEPLEQDVEAAVGESSRSMPFILGTRARRASARRRRRRRAPAGPRRASRPPRRAERRRRARARCPRARAARR